MEVDEAQNGAAEHQSPDSDSDFVLESDSDSDSDFFEELALTPPTTTIPPSSFQEGMVLDDDEEQQQLAPPPAKKSNKSCVSVNLDRPSGAAFITVTVFPKDIHFTLDKLIEISLSKKVQKDWFYDWEMVICDQSCVVFSFKVVLPATKEELKNWPASRPTDRSGAVGLLGERLSYYKTK